MLFSPKQQGTSYEAEMFGMLKCLELVTKTRHKNVSIYTDRNDAVSKLGYVKVGTKAKFIKRSRKSSHNWEPVRERLAALIKQGYTITIERYHPIQHKTWMEKAHELSREYRLKSGEPDQPPSFDFAINKKHRYEIEFVNREIRCNGIYALSCQNKTSSHFANFASNLYEIDKQAIIILPTAVYLSWFHLNLSKNPEQIMFIQRLMNQGIIIPKEAYKVAKKVLPSPASVLIEMM